MLRCSYFSEKANTNSLMGDHRSSDARLPINRDTAETISTVVLPNNNVRSNERVLEGNVSRGVIDGASLPTENATTSNATTSKLQPSSTYLELRPPTRGHTPFWKACLSVFVDWWVEFISFLVLCVSLVAIFITLYLHQDQPLPQWHLGITV